MQLRSTFALPAMVAVGLASCGSREQSDANQTDQTQQGDLIVGGRSDRGADPAVVAVDIGGEGLCSGALISARAVLTARHCVSYTTPWLQCPSLDSQVDGDRDPASLVIRVGNDARTAPVVARGQALIVPEGDVLCERDIAIILLDRNVLNVDPIGVELEEGVWPAGEVRAVGYGKRGDDLGAGKKYARDRIPVLSATRAEFTTGESSCQGDSGGPAFDSDTGRVVGVVSRGGASCEGPTARSIYTRVDAFSLMIQDAIGGRGPTPEARPCGVGHRCPNGFHCGVTHYCEKVK